MATWTTGELVTASKLNLWTVPPGGIIIWTGTIANIPSGWLICDGNNSTPNLLTRFLEGVATAATNPGTTGGATNKTTAGHIHGISGSQSNATGGTAYWAMNASPFSTNSITDTIADIRPLFYAVAWIMKS